MPQTLKAKSETFMLRMKKQNFSFSINFLFQISLIKVKKYFFL